MIPVWNQITGEVNVRDFDQGVMDGLDGVPFADPTHPCYSVPVPYPDGSTRNVSAYFDQPEAIFRLKIFPFITIHRDDPTLAMHRWMNVGQLEYRAGVSGTEAVINGVSGFLAYQAKIQAFPFDFTYTISGYDRYENTAQPILNYLLRHFPPLGKLFVTDSLGLQRSYEAYFEGSVANLQTLTDAVTRARGYAITVRVEGELDLTDPYVTSAVTGLEVFQHRF
jgi:hypothetical protein